MFFAFTASLVALSIAFMLLELVAMLLVVSVPHQKKTLSFIAILLSEVISATIYAAFIAGVTVGFRSHPEVTNAWVYAGFGFIFAFMNLWANVQVRRRSVPEYLSTRERFYPTQEEDDDRAALAGATVGMLAGLIEYPLFYTWPEAIAIIPGTSTLFTWVVGLANWLTSFWLGRVIVILATLGFFVNLLMTLRFFLVLLTLLGRSTSARR